MSVDVSATDTLSLELKKIKYSHSVCWLAGAFVM